MGGIVTQPEQEARAEIDRLLAAAGWSVQDFKAADIHAAPQSTSWLNGKANG